MIQLLASHCCAPYRRSNGSSSGPRQRRHERTLPPRCLELHQRLGIKLLITTLCRVGRYLQYMQCNSVHKDSFQKLLSRVSQTQEQSNTVTKTTHAQCDTWYNIIYQEYEYTPWVQHGGYVASMIHLQPGVHRLVIIVYAACEALVFYVYTGTLVATLPGVGKSSREMHS